MGRFSISHKIPSLISDFEWIVMLRCNYLLKSNFWWCCICLSKMIFSFFVLRIGLFVCLKNSPIIYDFLWLLRGIIGNYRSFLSNPTYSYKLLSIPKKPMANG